MKTLNGIQSTKSKYEVFKRNRDYNVLASQPGESVKHKSVNGPDGVITCCGSRYSPSAHALHLKGERISTLSCGVLVVDFDSWVDEQNAPRSEKTSSEEDEAILRAEQVDLYFKQGGKRTAFRVDGTTDWLTER